MRLMKMTDEGLLKKKNRLVIENVVPMVFSTLRAQGQQTSA